MNKSKLAICLGDLEYQTRFVNCFMNHYKHQYEVHVFTTMEELKLAPPLEFAVMIIGEYNTEEIANFVERGEIILVLTETKKEETNKEHLENLYFTEKYQEVYKIAEYLSRLMDEKTECHNGLQTSHSCKCTGVYSLSKVEYQLPFAALLARLHGEAERVLLLDLQAYSGLALCEVEGFHMGLEDLLSIATVGNYSKGRILECIGHEANWNYVYPVRNAQCLLEGSDKLYGTITDILGKELGYDRIIINFGECFTGALDMMERCEGVYLLCEREGQNAWREEVFIKDLQDCERDELCKKLHKVEIARSTATQERWEMVTEKWYWSTFGESIRCHVKEAQSYEATV